MMEMDYTVSQIQIKNNTFILKMNLIAAIKYFLALISQILKQP